jgi:hypothetical protein
MEHLGFELRDALVGELRAWRSRLHHHTHGEAVDHHVYATLSRPPFVVDVGIVIAERAQQR